MDVNGKIFKQFRLEKNLSVKEVAGNTVTPQFIRKFENGNSDIRLSNLQTLLFNMNVGASEFFSYSQQNIDGMLLNFEVEIDAAINSFSSFRLKELSRSLEASYYETGEQKYLFLNLLVKNYYQKLFESSEKSSLAPITNYLRNCNQWGKFELLLVTYLHKDLGFSEQEKYHYGKFILKKEYRQDELVRWGLDAALHLIFSLILDGSTQYAHELLNIFENKKRPMFLAFLDLYAKFIQGLYWLAVGKEEYGISLCEEVISIFGEVLEYRNYSNKLNVVYQQFREDRKNPLHD